MEHVKLLIAGSGPAGYTSAIYASRAALFPVLYEGMEPGGQITTTTIVENYPGFPEGIDGKELMKNFRKQAERLGAQFRRGSVQSINTDSRPFIVTLDDGEQLSADSIIISTGATAKYLGLPSEQKFRGMGVSACATCDGFFYRKQVVAVIGGGDTACEEASYLSSLCRKVYMIVRKPYLRASQTMQQRVLSTPNIEILFEHNTREILGDEDGVTGIRVVKSTGEQYDIDLMGVFLAIGHHPNTEWLPESIEKDQEGYILTQPGTSKTTVEGIFAAGDVADSHYRQVVVAAGSGCRAAIDAEKYLSMNNLK
ncbi:MAG: thioredoxin-disulfide reductase [Alistipes sp.]|nr:thioredoxin-disulfide reductase [Candidatus Alistipes equi]